MFFQYVLKGIADLSDVEAEQILTESGILCRWWSEVGEHRILYVTI